MEKNNLNIAVFGLGHIGLPTAALFAVKGNSVIGVDKDSKKIEMITQGLSPISEPGLDKLVKKAINAGNLTCTDNGIDAVKNSNIIIVVVPTPSDDKNKADLSFVKSVCNTISDGLKKDDLIIIESTVPQKTCDEILVPLLERSGLKAAEDFGIAYCPERAIPQNTIYEITNNTRVVGGIDQKSTSTAADVYQMITKGNIIKVKDMVTAETVKLIENTYRDVNIALANELSLICESIDVDAINAINAANHHPRVNVHTPGPGVGGHCLSIDPYFLVEIGEKNGVETNLIKTARQINNQMPDHVYELIKKGLKQIDKTIKGSKICILGITYKGNVSDIRETPAKPIIDKLKKNGAILYAHDPFVDKNIILSFGAKSLTFAEALSCDCVVLLADHDVYKSITPKILKSQVFICSRPILNPEQFINKGIIFLGVGRNYN